jgi:hypothetical protein
MDISCYFSRKAKVYQDICAPTDIKSRYISEDVPFILVPWYQLGARMGYEASAMKSIIDISSIMHGTDYMATGRTIEKMMLPTPEIRHPRGDLNVAMGLTEFVAV